MQNTKYLVVCYDYNGKKHRMVYSNYAMAMGINMFKGNVWKVSEGKRKLIKTCSN